MSHRRKSKRVPSATSGAIQRKKGRQSSSAAVLGEESYASPPSDARVARIEAANGFHALDEDCRLKILGFLELDDLAEASTVCRRFCDDCRHPSLPLIWERQLVLHVNGRASVFLRRLVELAERGTFENFCKVKVVVGRGMVGIWASHVDRIRGACNAPEVTELELSFESSDRPLTGRRVAKVVRLRGIWRGLAQLFPNLRRLTLSSARYTSWVPVDFARSCLWLESITWHGQPNSPFLCGDLCAAPWKEICMDDTTFSTLYPSHGQSEFYDQSPDTRCIFDSVLRYLERVSIKNAKYRLGRPSYEALPIPQIGLIKFVRRATNLRWFRSDLTPENVAMLQRERPEVTFVS
jgi:hypothetical protein